MKTLVVVFHPDIEESVINKRWVDELEKYPDRYTVHNLYKAYPDKVIDVEKEQKLIDTHEALVLQYPLYWFNCPPFLKQWLDDVFLYGWAYGSKGNQLKNKKVALAISAGIKEVDFDKEGEMKVSIEELIAPFRTTFLYTKSNFRGFHVLYDSHKAPEEDALENNVQEYIAFLEQFHQD